MLFLDTNIFLYAIGGDSEFRADCRRLLQAVGDSQIEAVTSVEVLQELLHVRARRSTPSDAVQAVRAASSLVSHVLSVTRRDLLLACKLFAGHNRLSPRDALHVAVMQSNNLNQLVSVDGNFDGIDDLQRLSPADALALVP